MSLPHDDIAGDRIANGWPFEERAPLMHWMAERRSEKERRHLSHVMVQL